MISNLPKDAMLCMSVVNTKLRDCYADLDALCEDLQVEKDELIQQLREIDYEYDAKRNQFV